MLNGTAIIVVNNIKLPIDASSKEAFSVARKRLLSVGITSRDLSFSVYRRSIDARNKNNIFFVWSVAVSGEIPSVDTARLSAKDMTLCTDTPFPEISFGTEELSAPPLVVGSGPCGLFAALLLAEHGYRPTLIERGGSVKERQDAVFRFTESHVLSDDTNIQFGAGGAGTFSDGKLVTRVNDPLTGYVLSRFIEFGAPEEIKYIAKPHVGTDVLSGVVEEIIARIESLGGRVIYHTKYISANFRSDKVVSVNTDKGEIPAGAVILAIGHSARDTYDGLISTGFSVEAKNFSVGMRIEHLAEDIDRSMYGDFAGDTRLGHAEYTLSHDTKNRGVYTFCMCPGGQVVAAASECGGVVVNGMSYHARDGKNSNSAVVSTIFKEDYGSTPRAAIDFQRKIERAAFALGGGEYRAPIITVGDFLDGSLKNEPKRIVPTYMNGTNVKLASPKEYLPSFVTSSIQNALLSFDKKIHGFAVKDAVLTGAETRTSAPVRILRDPVSRLAIGKQNFYPAGEGAGYAGGITSAAIDGLKTAISLMNKFKA